MIGADSLLRAREPSALAGARRLTVFYDERPIPASDADTVTSALLGVGVVATGRSLKYRRPRGPYCLQGDCGTCLVRIDGVPNHRACTTPVRDGMRVERQNRVLAGGPDPTALVDRLFASNIDHHHFMVRPKLVNRMMQDVARNLAGLGTLPDLPAAAVRPMEHRPQVLVVGAGRSGLAATARLRAAGLEVECLDRFDARWSTPTAQAVRWETPVFGIYPAEGVIAAIGGTADDRTLHTFRPSHVLIATGARDVMVPVPNNDLPGVFAARGLLGLLTRTDTALNCPTIVVGAPAVAQPLAARLGASFVAVDDVQAILGGSRVEAIATSSGKREAGCVALAARPAPVSELARQAGAEVVWMDAGFAVARDELGRCGQGPWTLWACGEACGVTADVAADDGLRVADNILAAVRSRPDRGPR